MATTGAIELIPEEISAVKEQTRTLNRVRVISFVLFFIFGGVSLGLFLLTQQRTSELERLEGESASQVAQIVQFAAIESRVLGLSAKASSLTQILSQRDYFSVVFSSVEGSRPSGLTVSGIETSQGNPTVTVAGSTFSFDRLAEFLENLVASNKGGTLFTDSLLTSVSLDTASGRASFVVEATIGEGGLKKPLSVGQD